METGTFEVVISGSGSNMEEWRRALGASSAELNIEKLTEEQKRVADRFGISSEDYARGLLALRYGRERRESEGRALGQHVMELLAGLGAAYELRSVIWEPDRLRWMLRIETSDQTIGVPVAFELAEDVVDSRVLSEIERLRTLLFEGVGRRDAISQQQRP